MILDSINQELLTLKEKKNYRSLPQLIHDGRDVTVDGRRMLNLSSNDYLGLANEVSLREAFLKTITPETFLPTSSSSRLLTGNFTAYQELEQQLATMFGAESALLFNSGYHANTGILPAVSDTRTLILADKLVHASLIDGIRLSSAKCIRYRHNDLAQLRRLLEENHGMYEKMIIVTESIFSMDGDEADTIETRLLQSSSLCRRSPRFRSTGRERLRMCRRTKLHQRHRLSGRNIREGGSIRRRIYRLPADHPGISDQ